MSKNWLIITKSSAPPPYNYIYFTKGKMSCLFKPKNGASWRLFWRNNLSPLCSKKVKLSPQKFVYQGMPPILSTKTPKLWRINTIVEVEMKFRTFPKKVKRKPLDYVYQGFPPILSTKTPKTWRINCILKVQIKIRTLSKKVNRSPQEYVYQGFPLILSTKTQKTLRNNCILKVKIKTRTSKPNPLLAKKNCKIEGGGASIQNYFLA